MKVYFCSQITAKKVVTINAKGNVEYIIPLSKSNSAYDEASLDDSIVAVSTGYSIKQNGISIVHLTNRSIIKYINLPDYSYGITFDGKSLICYVEGKALNVISFADYSVTTIPYTVLAEYSYISRHDDEVS